MMLVQANPIAEQVAGMVTLAVPVEKAVVPDRVVLTTGRSFVTAVVFQPDGITLMLKVVPTGMFVAVMVTGTEFAVVFGRVMSGVTKLPVGMAGALIPAMEVIAIDGGAEPKMLPGMP